MKYIYIIILLFAGITCSSAQPAIEGYEYWFNNDFANKTTTHVTPTQKLVINQNISANGLINGINIFNFRSFDNSGNFSSVVSHFFYKASASESNTDPEIVAYEYWLDDDYNSAVVVNTPLQQHAKINELISMTSLHNGVHNFNIRFKDNAGLWSSVASHFFYKVPEKEIDNQNTIVGYRYWFDEEFDQAVNVTLSTPALRLIIADDIDLTQVLTGQHTIHFQFKDSFGLWSVITNDDIEKTIEVSVIENSFAGNILVYPNPTNGNVFVDFEETLIEVKVLIHDIKGKLIRQVIYKSIETLEFDISEPSGIYFMTILSGNKKATIKLIKE